MDVLSWFAAQHDYIEAADANGFFRLAGAEERLESLVLKVDVVVDPDDDVPSVWEITCTEYRRNQISFGFFDELSIADRHPLLAEYQEPATSLYFNGTPLNVFATVGALHQLIRRRLGTWGDLEHFLSPGKQLNLKEWRRTTLDLEELLKGGHGLLAEGPRSLMEGFAAILAENGVATSLLVTNRPAPSGKNEAGRASWRVSVRSLTIGL